MHPVPINLLALGCYDNIMHYSTSGPRQSADHVKTASIFLHASSKKKLKKYTALDSSTESPRSLEAIETVMLWY